MGGIKGERTDGIICDSGAQYLKEMKERRKISGKQRKQVNSK